MTMRSGRTLGWTLAGVMCVAAVGWMLNISGVRAADMPMPAIKNAIAVVQPIGANKVTGTVTFTLMDDGLHVVADLTGLAPGKHGFHVHQFGDISDLGTATAGTLVGGHFDPGMVMKHGLPDSPMHMAGELGNVTADASGKAISREPSRVSRSPAARLHRRPLHRRSHERGRRHRHDRKRGRQDRRRRHRHHQGINSRHVRSSHQLVVDSIGVELETLSQPMDLCSPVRQRLPHRTRNRHGQGNIPQRPGQGAPDHQFHRHRMGTLVLEIRQRPPAPQRLRQCPHPAPEATYFVRNFLPDASLAAVHIYFPDPWPKARHHKRRLIQEPFVAQLARVLAPAGRLRIVTDHLDYFQQIESVLKSSSLLVGEYAPLDTADDGEVVGTNFERKYRREGRPFYAIQAEKRT